MATAVVMTAIGSVGVLWPDEPVRELRAGGQVETQQPKEAPATPDGVDSDPVPSPGGPAGTAATPGTAPPGTAATGPRAAPPTTPPPSSGVTTTGPAQTTTTATAPIGPATPPTTPKTTATTAAPAGAAARSSGFTNLVAFVDTDRDGAERFLAVVDSGGGEARRLIRMQGTTFSWAPDGVRIAFVEAGAIHVLDTGSGAIEALAGSRGVENQPVWSPDGNWIAYRDDSANEDKGLWLMHADGSERHRISGAISGAPAWSPDSTLLAFGALGNGTASELHVVSVDGTALRNLTAGEGGGSSPVFSPDGRRLAFTADGDTLAVAEVASSEIRRFPAVGKIASPSWAPNSRSILVQHIDGEATAIRTVDPATGSSRQLSPSEPGPEGQAAGYRAKAYTRPLWTPDGTAIVYQGDCRGTGGDLCRLDPGTGALTLLVDSASGPLAFQPRPDGGGEKRPDTG